MSGSNPLTLCIRAGVLVILLCTSVLPQGQSPGAMQQIIGARLEQQYRTSHQAASLTFVPRSLGAGPRYPTSAKKALPLRLTRIEPSFATYNREFALKLNQVSDGKSAPSSNQVATAELLIQHGEPAQALSYIQSAESLAGESVDPTTKLDWLRIKGAAYAASGELEQSILTYRNAITIARSINDETAQAGVYMGTGWAYQSLGKLQDALACYQAALYLFERTKNTEGQVGVHLAMGSLYRSMGETEEAKSQFSGAALVASSDQLARVRFAEADLLEQEGDLRAATKFYQEALSVAETQHYRSLTGTLQVSLGRCELLASNFATARAHLESARAIMREVSNQAGEAAAIATFGELSYWEAITAPTTIGKHGFSEAISDYDQALALVRQVRDRPGEIGVLTNLGIVFDEWGKPQQALPYYLDALSKIEEFQDLARLEKLPRNLSIQSAGLYERAVTLELASHHEEHAFELSERARGRGFLGEFGSTQVGILDRVSTDLAVREEKLRRESTLLERQLAQETATAGDHPNTARVDTLRLQLSAVRQQYRALLDEVRSSNPAYASFLGITPITFAEAQGEIRDGETVVSYFTASEISVAFILTKKRFDVVKLQVRSNELKEAVDLVRDFATSTQSSRELIQLYNWLIKPVEPFLKAPLLTIVPYGVLHELPFAALTPDGQQYLGDTYALSYLPSVSVLPYIRRRAKPSGIRSVVVVGNDTERTVPILAGAVDEARDVAALYGESALVSNTVPAALLKNRAGEFDVVHVIAHIEVEDPGSQFSGTRTKETSEGEGPLELSQVLASTLRDTNLVVLSGCVSHEGERSRGDDIVSLSRAFMYAGSPSVVASLWTVDDEATKQLMLTFYKYLKEGQGKAEALRLAQQEVRQDYPHPYYWAGFVLDGDPGDPSTALRSFKAHP